MKVRAIVGAILLSFAGAAQQAYALPPGFYGLLGIVPGLGHVSQGNWSEGGAYFGTVVGGSIYSFELGYKRYPEAAQFVLTGVEKSWEYNMYDAYNDAGKFNDKTLLGNFASAFDVRHFASPAVSIPLGLFGLLLVPGPTHNTTVFGKIHRNKRTASAFALGSSYGFSAMVGTGEEALFRGFIQQSLSNNLSPWVGIPLASAVFGMAHDYSVGGQIYVGLLGAYMGVLAHNDKYDLGRAIFFHSVYDTLVFFKEWKAGKSVPFAIKLPPIQI